MTTPKTNGWEEEFDKRFAMYPDFDGKFIKKATYCKDVKDFIAQAILSAEEAKVRECIEKVDWILTPHGYESDNPEFEKFALKLKDKYRDQATKALSNTKTE